VFRLSGLRIYERVLLEAMARKWCSECGAELVLRPASCPLCGAEVTGFPETKKPTDVESYQSDVQKLRKQLRALRDNARAV
jgi:predicted RNA-binding protein with PUA domain